MPLHSLSSSASSVTGLEVKNGELVLDSEPVSTVSQRVLLGGLLTFLRSIPETIILIAHHGFKCDAPLITKFVQERRMLDNLTSVVCGNSQSGGLPKQVSSSLNYPKNTLDHTQQ